MVELGRTKKDGVREGGNEELKARGLGTVYTKKLVN